MATIRDFWYDPASATKSPNWFNEGPQPPRTKSTSLLTSSIDTSAIDGYRQGVEITQQSYFDQGTFKISAGEPGHVLAKTRFGQDKTWDTDPRFQDIDYFNPVRFLRAQDISSPLLMNLITFPIQTSDNQQIENYNFDGVIEPITIRARAAFFSTDVPFEAHDVKGALMGGNSDSNLASDRVLTVDYVTGKKPQPFLDMIDMFGPLSTVGFFIVAETKVNPFADARFVGNVVHSASIGNDMLSAITLMTGSTSNYVSSNKVSATSGWTFENNSVGTDSITYGGRTF